MRREDLVEAARLALEGGDPGSAARHCDAALEDDPDDARAKLYKAAALLVQCGPGCLEEAGREVLAGASQQAAPAGAALAPEAPGGVAGRRTELPPGQPDLIAGKYEMLARIGEGGMGLVYEARDRRLGRRVAVKKMRPEIKLSLRERKRFMDEARTAAGLHHDYIVEIYDIVEEQDEIYLVFEFLPGPTLEKVLDQEGKVSLARAGPWLKCVCEALSFAHSKGMVHCDVKPANIMLSGVGNAKVMDFGIAAQAHATVSRLTGVQTPGTAAYMAPEQHMGRFDARSDVYSLGVAAYELLSGEIPFPGPDFCLQKERMSFKPLSGLAPGIPQEIAAAVERCLQFDPAKRLQGAAELSSALGL